MTAEKQSRGNAGKGRRKGVPNKTTGAVKQMVLTALKRGGVQYLEEQAHKNPFMSLLGKILPRRASKSGTRSTLSTGYDRLRASSCGAVSALQSRSLPATSR